MIDLTKIREPFGLLDEATQKALREHGGPYQRFWSEGWKDTADPRWWKELAYRVKPAPPKPREFWMSDPKLFLGTRTYFSQEEALAAGLTLETIIHVREVLE